MPWKQNLSPAQVQYSPDLNQRVVYQAYTLMKTTTEIAINLNMPVHVVKHILMNWQKTGDVCKDQAYMGRATLMKKSSVKVCVKICALITSDILHTGMADAWAPWPVSKHVPQWSLRAVGRSAQHHCLSSHNIQNPSLAGHHIQDSDLLLSHKFGSYSSFCNLVLALKGGTTMLWRGTSKIYNRNWQWAPR